MAKIVLEGNVGKVETGKSTSGENTFISFSVAERFAYFDEQQGEWIEKGTQWHECIIWVKSDNEKKLIRLIKFIVKGAGVMIAGRTSINPAEREDQNGNKVKYLNPFIIVDDIALTTERLENVVYKPKAQKPAVTDPEIEQQAAQPNPEKKTFDDARSANGNSVNMSDDHPF